MKRLEVLKTYKIFIGGQFPRTESGRYFQLKSKQDKVIANVCLSSRKDFKAAVVAARKAFEDWGERKVFNRSQILYRIAEMLEGRKSQFVDELILQGSTKKNALQEVETSIDRLIYYAGWCDKFQQIFSSINPVSSSHYNFSEAEPMGVVAVIASSQFSLLGIVSTIAPIISGGNVVVILASETQPLSAISFAEVLSTSDLPAGVVNILTGKEEELHTHFSSHLDVNALVHCNTNESIIKTCMENCSLNVKRFFHWNKNWMNPENQNPYLIMDLQEIKTTWHPIQNTGASALKY